MPKVTELVGDKDGLWIQKLRVSDCSVNLCANLPPANHGEHKEYHPCWIRPPVQDPPTHRPTGWQALSRVLPPALVALPRQPLGPPHPSPDCARGGPGLCCCSGLVSGSPEILYVLNSLYETSLLKTRRGMSAFCI